jgi:2-deoxy-D-gluconate 3-dehydrogenase
LLDEFDLTGRVAIVTGGNRGIGRGIAVGLARAGADIAVAARNRETTAEVVDEVRGLGRHSLGVACDVTLGADVARTVASVLDELGRIDILVNNAGISLGGRPETLPEESWDRVLDTNLKAVLRFSQAVYPALKDAGGGKVINIGSEYSIFGSPQVVAYAASKGGVIQMTKSLAVAWAGDGIQVNAIIPGWVRTDMTAPVIDHEPMYRSIVGRTPAGRFAEPEELAGAAVFLASAASDFVTGQSIVVDGGYSVS